MENQAMQVKRNEMNDNEEIIEKKMKRVCIEHWNSMLFFFWGSLSLLFLFVLDKER